MWTHFEISEKDPRIAVCKACNAERFTLSQRLTLPYTIKTSRSPCRLRDGCRTEEESPSQHTLLKSQESFPVIASRLNVFTQKIKELVALDDQVLSVVENTWSSCQVGGISLYDLVVFYERRYLILQSFSSQLCVCRLFRSGANILFRLFFILYWALLDCRHSVLNKYFHSFATDLFFEARILIYAFAMPCL